MGRRIRRKKNRKTNLHNLVYFSHPSFFTANLKGLGFKRL